MNKIKIITIIFTVMLMLSGTASSSSPYINDTKYLGINTNFNTLQFTNQIFVPDFGTLIIVENYYGKDSNGYPKFYSSNRHFNGHVSAGIFNLDISRPKDNYKTTYSSIETIFILNNIRHTTWYNLK